MTEPFDPRGKTVEELTAFLARSLSAGNGEYLKIDIEAEIKRVEQWLAEIGAEDVFIGPVVDGKAVFAFTLPLIVTMLIIPPELVA